MRIQVIHYTSNNSTEKDGIFYSPLRSPRALDDYDVNVIDMSVSSMWKYSSNNYLGQIDAKPDLLTIQQMVENKKRALVVYVLPQNVTYYYSTRVSSPKTVPLKDVIRGVYEFSISKTIPGNAIMTAPIYEKTCTLINGVSMEADFYLTNPIETITKSERSEKPTTIRIADNVYVTTLAITKNSTDTKHYLESLFEKHERESVPEWMAGVTFGDDSLQQNAINQCEAQIAAAKEKIKVAENKLKENTKFKSILYTNGDDLVEVVFDILEKILACDLSAFVDDKKEDFLIKMPACTFIGEIKGVTSNVKYEHISQVELHYRGYLDRLAESGVSENVKQLLIMNPFRTKALDKRDPVHISQVDLAIRNGCLIIETNTLLRLYEKFCNGEVTVQRCIDVLSSKTGLLCLADFDEDAGDIDPYKV